MSIHTLLILIIWVLYYFIRIMHNFMLYQPASVSTHFRVMATSAAHPFLLLVFVQIAFDIFISTNTPVIVFYLGYLAVGTGFLFIVGAHYSLGRNYSAAIATRTPNNIVTCGLYKVVRHPIYSGSILMAIGSECVLYSPLICMVVLLLPLIVWQIYKEEKLLKKQFGLQWDMFVHKTPYRIVPYIF